MQERLEWQISRFISSNFNTGVRVVWFYPYDIEQDQTKFVLQEITNLPKKSYTFKIKTFFGKKKKKLFQLYFEI